MDKSPDAFRTISEVAELLDTPAHVLRFWESRFPQIKPVKRAGGRRYYRPVDVDLLIGIRKLLHDEGLTIRGVQKVLREQGVRHVSGLSEEDSFDDEPLTVIPEAAKRSTAPIPLFPVAKQAAAKPPAPRQEPPQTEPLDAPLAAPSHDDLLPPEVTEDAIDLGTEVAGSATTPQPADDEVEDDMRKNPTKAVRDPNTPELPFDPPSPQQADPLPPADSPVDAEDSSTAGNIFVEAEVPAEEAMSEPEMVSATETQGADSSDAVSTTTAEPAQIDEPAPDSLTATSGSDSANDSDTMPVPSETEGADPAIAAQSTPSAPDSAEEVATPLKHALPVLDTSEIHAEWLPADLRGLRADAFGAKRPEAAALFQRLQTLRNRVGDLGRVPRR